VENIEWLISNCIQGDVSDEISGDVPEHLEKMLKARREFYDLKNKTDLVLLREAFDRLKVDYRVEQNRGKVRVSGRRDIYKCPIDGNLKVRWHDQVFAEYDTFLCTEESQGIMFFFLDGKCVHHYGVEQ
jgi:hypothetical protein